MTERETLLAEIAERQARLAELDAEPDYEAWRPALEAFHASTGWGTAPLWGDERCIRGLIAALAKAPPTGSVMTEAEQRELAREAARNSKGRLDAATYSIRETLSRVQPRWPSEEELFDMETDCASDGYELTAVRKFSRRIRAYQQGERA